MNCSICGTEIPFDERFCRNCGREVVPLAPTVISGSTAGDPQKTDSFVTEQLNAAAQTQRYTARAQTERDWTPPPVSAPPEEKQDRRSSLLPLTVASIVIALVSLGALAYFVFMRSDGETASSSTEKPKTTPSPIASTPAASPTPTTQPSVTPSPAATPAPTATPPVVSNNDPPPGARLGYCNDTNVFVRSAPNLTARPVSKLARGQNIWVISTSTNYSTWNGITSNWTQVQLYKSSVRGWVFSPFVSFQTDR